VRLCSLTASRDEPSLYQPRVLQLSSSSTWSWILRFGSTANHASARHCNRTSGVSAARTEIGWSEAPFSIVLLSADYRKGGLRPCRLTTSCASAGFSLFPVPGLPFRQSHYVSEFSLLGLWAPLRSRARVFGERDSLPRIPSRLGLLGTGYRARPCHCEFFPGRQLWPFMAATRWRWCVIQVYHPRALRPGPRTGKLLTEMKQSPTMSLWDFRESRHLGRPCRIRFVSKRRLHSGASGLFAGAVDT